MVEQAAAPQVTSIGVTQNPTPVVLLEGDILFQSTIGDASDAIKLATHSAFSHVGILMRDAGHDYVFEAVGPVKATELHAWIERDPALHYTVKRLRTAAQTLTDQVRVQMRNVGLRYQGRRYDFAFSWSDDELYCSELVWKIYHEGANIDLGKPRPMRTFDLESPTVQAVMRERYGTVVPLDAPMISPQQIAESPLLYTVYAR
jgi:Permuted papain-like amidase enzyme, YaeF/YiiX, C92 family